ncbi:hypothetical protein QE152_g37321 [Popillia japonica]|uniref:Uncharacterized protein n=1 Tax=Popillia japonica TaxID=7064 RepID=A0AAW1IAZ6_POPJA
MEYTRWPLPLWWAKQIKTHIRTKQLLLENIPTYQQKWGKLGGVQETDETRHSNCNRSREEILDRLWTKFEDENKGERQETKKEGICINNSIGEMKTREKGRKRRRKAFV